jgi:hypothetical protein
MTFSADIESVLDDIFAVRGVQGTINGTPVQMVVRPAAGQVPGGGAVGDNCELLVPSAEYPVPAYNDKAVVNDSTWVVLRWDAPNEHAFVLHVKKNERPVPR